MNAFLQRGYRVVANSRNITKSTALAASDNLALVDGDIGDPATAAKIAETAVARFGTIDVLVNNAGIFFSKPFVAYTKADFESLISTNVAGFLYVTQRAVQQMLAQNSGGSIINVTTTMAQHPIAGIPSAVPMITKGGPGIGSLAEPGHRIREAVEFAPIAVAATGVVDTISAHESANKGRSSMKSLSPMGRYP